MGNKRNYFGVIFLIVAIVFSSLAYAETPSINNIEPSDEAKSYQLLQDIQAFYKYAAMKNKEFCERFWALQNPQATLDKWGSLGGLLFRASALVQQACSLADKDYVWFHTPLPVAIDKFNKVTINPKIPIVENPAPQPENPQ